jgi:hypothetical protein
VGGLPETASVGRVRVRYPAGRLRPEPDLVRAGCLQPESCHPHCAPWPGRASPLSVIGVEAGDQDSGLRLAELVAAFSLATGLGMGQPMEHVLRSWLIAVRLGDRMDLGPRRGCRCIT